LVDGAAARRAVLVVLAFVVAVGATWLPGTIAGATPTVYDVSDATGLAAAVTAGNDGGAAYEIVVHGTITLTGALPALTEDVTVRGGSAASDALDGAGAYRILEVGGAHELVLRDLTLRHGLAADADGGAVFAGTAGSAVRATRTVFDGNEATGSQGDGGAVRGKVVELVDSTFVGNASSNHGGAVVTDEGAVTVTGSTFSGNEAVDSAAAILTQGPATIENSTFTGNTGPNVLRFERGGGAVRNVTIAGNDADGIRVDELTVTVRNAIVVAGTGHEPCTGATVDAEAGHNLFDQADADCPLDTDAGDLVGNDPQLGPLADNGGPTETMAPEADSPVLDAGADCPALDQRGEPRDGACDLGAVQASAPPATTTTSTTTTTTSTTTTTTTTTVPPSTTSSSTTTTTTTTTVPPSTTSSSTTTTTRRRSSGSSTTSTSSTSTSSTTTSSTTTSTTTTSTTTTSTTAPPATTTTTARPRTTTTAARPGGDEPPEPPAEEVDGPAPDAVVTEPVAPPAPAPVVSVDVGGLGGAVVDGTVEVEASGLAPGSPVSVVVHSDPVVLGSGTADDAGAFRGRYVLPELEPGDHRVILEGTSVDGTPVAGETGLSVAPGGTIVRVADREAAAPAVAAPAAPADGPVALPAYEPVDDVEDLVEVGTGALAALALVGVGGAAAAGVAGGAASGPSAAPRRSARLRGGEVSSLDAATAAEARGDSSRTWRWPGTTALDRWSRAVPSRLAPLTPLGARIANDGAALRAMLGSLWLALPVLGAVLGGLAVASSSGEAVPPAFWLVLALAVLGVLDATSGLVGGLTFGVGVVVLGGIHDGDSVRGLLGIVVLWFAVALIASTARPIRRAPGGDPAGRLERLGDVVIIALMGAWMGQLMIGSLPGLTGYDVPLTERADQVALALLVALVVRVSIETAGAHLYPGRLAAVAPESLPAPGTVQVLAGTLVRVGMFAFVALAFLGPTWSLWAGTALFAVPQLLALAESRLRNLTWLHRLLPRGTAKLLVLLVVGAWLGAWLGRRVADPADLLAWSFVVLALPASSLTVLGLFGRAPAEPAPVRPMTVPAFLGGAGLVGLTVLAALGVIP
jgi:hypothetical protein